MLYCLEMSTLPAQTCRTDPPVADIEISLLGPWQLRYPAGPIKKEPRRKEQGLLAYLAVEASQAHSRDSLVGLLWPHMPASDARNNLRVALSRLKRHLGDNDILETTRHTVRFITSNQARLDVGQFQALIKQTEGHDHRSVTACGQCQDRLEQAVKLYRGEFLAGFFLEDCLAFEEWLFVWRERLHMQMLKQLGYLVQAAEEAGRFADGQEYARRQIELDPLHELAHRQLMRMLYAQGQRSAALSQFQTCEQIMREELGVEPEAETVLLRQEIQAGTLDIAPSKTKASQVSSPTLRRYALPENTTPFIGRDTELDQLSRRLTERSYRLISLVGPGGIGKTRLAIEAARGQRDAFQDGVVFVPLEGVQTAADIPAAMAEALGITFTGSAESPRAEIIQILQDKQLLLVIDNLEHVIQGGADLLLEIIQTAAEVMLLVTSREQLNAHGEDLFRLRGLPYPTTDTDADAARYGAVRLFADRAHRINKGFALAEDTLTDVVHICRLVEGLPLALELAATWVRDVSVNQIAVSLQKDLDFLATDLRDILPRHRNMAAVFEHSWGLLESTEQMVLAKLAVFRGSFAPDAARHVSGAPPLVLTRLRYKSLLRGSGDGRYTIHELLRQLSLRKLNENPAVAEQTQTQHSDYFLALLQAQAEYLKGENAAQVGATLRLELDNIRQAWRWAVETSALARLRQSAAGIAAFFIQAGLGFEGAQLFQTAIDSQGIQTEENADLLPFLMVRELYLLDSISTWDQMKAKISRVLALTERNPALSHLAAETYLIWSRSYLAQVSNPKQARVYLDQAFAVAEGIDDPELAARLYCESGRNYRYDGQFDEAIVMLEKALTIFEKIGHLPGQAMVYGQLAPAYAEGYRLGPALFCDRRALQLYTQIDNHSQLGISHNNLAETYMLLGAYEQARNHILKSLEIYRQQDNKVLEANTRSQYAAALAALGQSEQAEKQYRTAINAQKTIKLNFSLRFSLLDWGAFQHHQGWLDEAEITFDEAITLNADLPHMRLTSQAKQAMVYLAQSRRREALSLVDEVWDKVEPNQGAGLPFPIHTMYECYSVFQACADDRAETALQMAADVLKRTAAEIDDPQMRSSFLNNVPVNVSLRQALQND